MSLSNDSMNAGTSTSVSAAVMEPTRLITSEDESPRKGVNAKQQARRNTLRAVAGIDLNVFFREVAGPKSRAARASAMQDDADAAFGFIQFFLEVRFGEIGRQARAANRHVLQVDVHFGGIERDASIAGRRKNTAPVGRSEERRVG